MFQYEVDHRTTISTHIIQDTCLKSSHYLQMWRQCEDIRHVCGIIWLFRPITPICDFRFLVMCTGGGIKKWHKGDQNLKLWYYSAHPLQLELEKLELSKFVIAVCQSTVGYFFGPKFLGMEPIRSSFSTSQPIVKPYCINIYFVEFL